MEESDYVRQLILDAIEARDWDALRELSILPKGLEAARLEAW